MTRTEARRLAWHHAWLILDGTLDEGWTLGEAENREVGSRDANLLDDAFDAVLEVCKSRSLGNAPKGYRTVKRSLRADDSRGTV